MTDREAECSARSNSEFPNIISPTHFPSETDPLLPTNRFRQTKLDLTRMTLIVGEKRASSFSPPPLSRHAAAPPPSPTFDHGSTIDTPRRSSSVSPSATRRSGVSTPPSQDQTDQRTLFSWVAKVSPSVTIENSGSVARDHLASERTFLAYVRTSLAIASTGVGEHVIILGLYIFHVFFNQFPQNNCLMCWSSKLLFSYSQ
jgi:hypothetical protein